MNILIVSECDKRALVQSRRILDQFAERRGRRTWQTSITEAGLKTLHEMLRAKARKNTAVACHWIRGIDNTELLWVVGDSRRFNPVGAVPTNRTESDVLRQDDESPWRNAEDVKLLAAMAALFHDFGKASRAFQAKLRANAPVADAYRHEWVSLRLFESFVARRTDREWLADLADPAQEIAQGFIKELSLEPARAPQATKAETIRPFDNLGPVAAAVGWLVVSHHRLPYRASIASSDLGRLPQAIKWDWCHPNESAPDAGKRDCGRFERLPFASRDWRARAAKVAQALLSRIDLLSAENPVRDPLLMGAARLALVLADHHYSSLPSQAKYGDADFPLAANTDRATGSLKQRLDEHLIGVAAEAKGVVRSLVRLPLTVPRLENRKAFRQRATSDRFRWQDKAFDLAEGVAERSRRRGFFGVNMASTGCGKTLANARVMAGLANGEAGVRFTIALGLRTLTLQTGSAIRERLGLSDAQVAVAVGGSAIRQLFERAQAEKAEENAVRVGGSASANSLALPSTWVDYAPDGSESPLYEWLQTEPSMTKLLQAPILTCTIDHLMPACEATRGGHFIVPLLRLFTSDLVLDEPDDFDLADLPALTRLVFTAGWCGARVLLSSATLPPDLIQGLFRAYSEGRRWHRQHFHPEERGEEVTCAWFDEFGCEGHDTSAESFGQHHRGFVDKRLARLAKAPARRKAELLDLPRATSRGDAVRALGALLPDAIRRLHDANATTVGDQRVSFGLVRMANVDPLIDVARALFDALTSESERRLIVHVCVYHSKQILLVRSDIERTLDAVLRRSDPLAFVNEPAIAERLAAGGAEHAFVVLASPVAEVGRDHDYDWAIVEPSSMRSLIQLVGRVRRHRPEPHDATNVLVLSRNLKAAGGMRPAYCMPGFESSEWALRTHDLASLVSGEELAWLDARPRITRREMLAWDRSLVDLEHARLADLYGAAVPGAEPMKRPASLCWESPAGLVGVLPKEQRFRSSSPNVTYARRLDEDDGSFRFFRREDEAKVSWTMCDSLFVKAPELPSGSRIWGVRDYPSALAETARLLVRDSLARVAEEFGTASLSEREATHGWQYHEVLGFRRNSGLEVANDGDE